MIDDRAHGIRVKIDKGRNMIVSALTDLAAIRREVGAERLNAWCIDNLKMGISVITLMAKVLKDVDAKIERENLREATEAEKARRRVERERKAQEALERRLARQAAKMAQKARLEAHNDGTRAWRKRIVDNGVEAVRNAVTCGAISLTRGAEIAALPTEQQLAALRHALGNPRNKPKPRKKPTVYLDGFQTVEAQLRVINSR